MKTKRKEEELFLKKQGNGRSEGFLTNGHDLDCMFLKSKEMGVVRVS